MRFWDSGSMVLRFCPPTCDGDVGAGLLLPPRGDEDGDLGVTSLQEVADSQLDAQAGEDFFVSVAERDRWDVSGGKARPGPLQDRRPPEGSQRFCQDTGPGSAGVCIYYSVIWIRIMFEGFRWMFCLSLDQNQSTSGLRSEPDRCLAEECCRVGSCPDKPLWQHRLRVCSDLHNKHGVSSMPEPERARPLRARLFRARMKEPFRLLSF